MNLQEIKHNYYDRGFSLLWLHPKSKRPVELKWTSIGNKSWKQLHHAYKSNMNVGVRLGGPSKVEGGFLAVLDVDVKDTEPQAWEEARKRLKELFPKLRLNDSPVCLSGRGNGSRHVYVLTKEPCSPQRLAQSPRKVKVHMPSVKPSRHELDTLTADQISKGIRIRPAWEISLMGQGQQVVLPPSIHPDSGKAYKWKSETWTVPQTIDPPKGKVREHEDVIDDIKFEEVDLFSSNVPDSICDLIVSGTGSEDRSADCFKAAMSLLRAGFTRRQVLSVLTNKEYFLGQTGFDHAQTRSRRRAAQWVSRYTLGKAAKETDAAKDFENLVVSEKLSEKEADEQFEELIEAQDWRQRLDRGGDSSAPPKATIKNIVLILENTIPEGKPFIHNEFSNRDFYGCDTPWGGKQGVELTDQDIIKIRLWLSRSFRFEPARDKVADSVIFLSNKNRFHPVREYLNGLTWDGTERIDTWLREYSGATGPEPYLTDVSRKVLIAMVARIFVPGIKFDHILVLEGKQGVGKSSVPRMLASEPWYNETLPDIRDKDAMLNLLGAWINEVSELATLKRADTESYKAFFTRQTDRVRAPYGERWQEYRRQCVFIGTTNGEDYLQDKTGNRRFWPVKIKQLQFDRFEEVRDQLFAEAVWHWKNLGEKLYLSGNAEKQAQAVQASRVAEDEQDAMADQIRVWVRKVDDATFDLARFKLSDLFGENGPWPEQRPDNWRMQKAGRALRQLKFEKYVSMGKNWWRLNTKKQ